MDNTKINEIKNQFIELIDEDMMKYMIRGSGISFSKYNNKIINIIKNSNNWDSADEYELEISDKEDGDYGMISFKSGKPVSDSEMKDFSKICESDEYGLSCNGLSFDFNPDEHDLPPNIFGSLYFRTEICLDDNDNPIMYRIIED